MKNALAYVRVAEVGGASPAVIEAMGQATCVIANDKSENREMISDTGFLYPLNTQQLSIVFRDVAADPARAVELGKKAAQRAMLLYGWDTIAYDYYRLIKKLAHEKVYIPKKQNVMEPGGYERKRILITGSAGVLGTELYKHFKTNFSVCASTLKPRESWQVALDITNTVACERLVAEFKPDYIIHAAALTDLEKCEQNLSDAYASNTQPVKILAQLASRYHAKFIFVSTANVFNGEKKIYNEYDEPTPINVYGLTKHMGELMTAYYSHNYLIIRLGWLVGGGPTLDKKFVAKIVEQLSSGSRELHVVSDKFGTISYAPDVVRMLQYLLEKNSTGVYHIAATGITSRFKMAEFIVNTLGYEGKVVVTPVKSLYFSNIFPTPRPHYECLVSARLHREGVEVLHTWEVALEEYLGEYFKYAYRKKPNRSVRLRSVGAKS
jgi:dTDP-4-dehydrorhamnose reductase